MSLDKKSAVQILNSRAVIAAPGKYTVKVTSTTPFIREGVATTIVNFAAMTAYQLSKAQEHFAAGEYDEACNLNMSASQLQGRYVPSKGEVVDVEVTEITNKEDINILVVDSIVPRQATVAARAKFSFDEEEGNANSVSVADMKKALIDAGELTTVKANKLSEAEINTLYAQLQPEII